MAENTEQTQILKELKSLLEQKTNGNGSFLSHLKGMQAFVYLIVILVGVGINWGVSTAKLSSMQTSVTSMEEKLQEQQIIIHKLELSQAVDDRTLIVLQADILEIKIDLKKLIARREE